jgi:hypothetical protein
MADAAERAGLIVASRVPRHSRQQSSVRAVHERPRLNEATVSHIK